MKLSQVIATLWNGGLNPATAPALRLGERRMVSAIGFIIVPCSLILIVGNIIFIGDLVRVATISSVMCCAIAAIYIQAYKDMHRTAALGVLFALWFSPLVLMLNEGFSSTNWAWLLPVILLANYIMSRRASIVFTAMSVVALAAIALLTSQGTLGQEISVANHARTVAVAGSMIFILACILGYAYRSSQLKSEQQLLDSMSVLREEVETRRTAEMKALAGERAKATFLATVSHELRTPLNGVLGASQLLAAQELDSEKEELVSIINSSADVLLEVINDVLDLTRLDEDKLELNSKPIALVETIEACLSPLRIMSEKKQLHLTLHVSQQSPQWIMADGGRIRQLLMNVIGNAVKFTHEGGIDVYLDSRDGGIQIAVSDTGIGIPENKQQEIFDPFVQADSSVDRRFGGSGLGLTIVQRLIKLFNGSIELESAVGKGSTFTIWIPAEECDAPPKQTSISDTAIEDETPELAAAAISVSKPEPATPPVETHPGQESKPIATENSETGKLSVRVLVTDDNVVNRKVASKLLQKLGCETIEAADGIEALDSLSEGNIDVVLMDVQMPNMDGLTATSEIRKMNSPLCDTPIIGLSANAMPDDQKKMLKAGMDSYLAKPVHLEQLQSAISAVSEPSKPPM